MPATRPRARDLGLPLPGTPGPHNSITDVPGAEVGFTTIARPAAAPGDVQVYTGVTAILPRGKRSRPVPVLAGVTEAHALAALRGAAGGPVVEGNVGGGTGMATYECKGGTGTSSRRFSPAMPFPNRDRSSW